MVGTRSTRCTLNLTIIETTAASTNCSVKERVPLPSLLGQVLWYLVHSTYLITILIRFIKICETPSRQTT